MIYRLVKMVFFRKYRLITVPQIFSQAIKEFKEFYEIKHFEMLCFKLSWFRVK